MVGGRDELERVLAELDAAGWTVRQTRRSTLLTCEYRCRCRILIVASTMVPASYARYVMHAAERCPRRT